MIKLFVMLFKSFKCTRKGHELVDAGSCPFTGLTYKTCISCGGMIAVDNDKNV